MTVKFEINSTPFTLPNVTVPMVGPEYIRYPTQAGDKGVVVPFDVLLGAISGLGGNVANLAVPPSNLGAFVFTAVSNVNWSVTDDANAVVIYGPNGFVLRDTGKNCSIVGNTETITVTGKTSLIAKVGSNASITITDGEIDISATTIKLNGIVWGTHEHTGVQTGAAKTGGPTSP